jgi:hypothetical protein
VLEAGQDLLGYLFNVVDACNVRENNDELIPGKPRDRIVVADSSLQAPGKLTEQSVARVMAERIIDSLEIVEIKKQKGKISRMPRRLRDRRVHSFIEKASVWKTRQVIMIGAETKLFLCSLAFGHIAKHKNRAVRAARIIDYHGSRNIDGRLPAARSGKEHIAVGKSLGRGGQKCSDRIRESGNNIECTQRSHEEHLVYFLSHKGRLMFSEHGCCDAIHNLHNTSRVRGNHTVADGCEGCRKTSIGLVQLALQLVPVQRDFDGYAKFPGLHRF